jgi:hypothetical protein
VTVVDVPAPEARPGDLAAPAGERSDRATAPWGGPVGAALLVVVAVLHLTIGLWQAAHDSVGVDEAVDVSSGVATLVRQDLRLNPEHPPLPKVLSALPALAARPVVPDTPAWRDGDWFGFTDDFLQANREAGRLDRVLFLARLVPLAEGLACGWLVFRLGRRLFGPVAGVIGAVLWLTTPLVVGLSHLAGIDVPFALATLVVADRLLAYVDAPTLRRAAFVGGACAAALATRHSGFALWAFAVVVVAAVGRRSGDTADRDQADARDGVAGSGQVAGRRVAWRAPALVVVAALAGVWAVYLVLQPGGPSPVAADRGAAMVADAADRSFTARLTLAVPMPPDHRAGLGYLVLTSDERPAYLFGQTWDGSRPWYFPGALLAKLPLAATAAVVLAPLALRRSVGAATRRRALLAVAGPAAVGFGFVLAQPLNLGVRYVLPSLALVLVLAGGGVARLFAGLAIRPRRVLAVAGLAVQVVAMAEARTHALAWTTPPFRPAYRWVSDSNVDYAQDLGRVDDWVAAQRAATPDEPVHVSLLRPRGVLDPVGTAPLRAADPGALRGWVVVSATRLTALDREALSWLRAYCPVGTIGGSVLLYRFAAPPDTSAGPSMPVTSCSAGRFSTRA